MMTKHNGVIKLMAKGALLWDKNPDLNDMERKLIDDFRYDCQNIILTMKHHTKSTESGVQEIAI